MAEDKADLFTELVAECGHEANDLGNEDPVEISDVKNVESSLDKVKAGLQSDSDAPVPLKSVHIRAKLLDLAAQVT